MKPISLTIEGLNSFERAQTIDFTALTADGLFGIFGPTGSGKSTIIDAMTLALYGEMPRFRKEKQKEWINLNCTEMAVRYLFSLNGETYVSERRFKRAKQKPPLNQPPLNQQSINQQSINQQSMNQQSMSQPPLTQSPLTQPPMSKHAQSDYARLYVLRGGESELLAERPQSVNNEILRLIGLSYDDFTRSVLLPQGRFSEFLLLENKERRMMLERVFHLEAYGEAFNERVRNETSAVRERLAIVENNVALYEKDGALTAEAIKTAQRQLAEDRKLLTLRQTELTQGREKYTHLIQVQADVRRYREVRAKEVALLAREAEMVEAEARLAQSERGARVVPYGRACTETAKRLTENETALAAAQAEHAASETAGEAGLRAYETAAKRKRDEYPLCLQAVAAYTQALRLIDQLAEAENEREALRVAYKAQQNRQKKAQTTLEQAEEAEKQTEETLRDITEGRNRASVTPAFRQLIETGVAEARRLDEYRQRLDTAAAEREAGRREYTEALQAATATERQRMAAEAACHEARENMEAARFRHDFAAVAGTLTDGAPCPLCGATTHPTPASPIDEDEWQRINQRFDATNDRLTRANQADREAGTILRVAQERQNRAISAYEEAESLYKQKHTQWTAWVREAGTEDFTELRRQINQKDVLRVELDEKEAVCRREAAEVRLRRDTAARTLTEAVSALGAIRQQGQEKGAHIEKHRAEINRLCHLHMLREGGKGLPTDVLADVSLLRTEVQARLTQAEQAAAKLTRDEENTHAAYKQADAARQQALRKQEGLIESGETLRRMLAEQETALARALEDSGLPTAAAAEACLLTDEQKHQMTRDVGEYRTQLAIVGRDVRTLAEKLAETDTTDIDARVENGTAKIRSMEVETDRIKEQITLGQERMAAMETSFAAVQELKRERANLTGRYDLLYELSDLLRGNAFVEYMAIDHLHYITADASQRLKRMTANRYALELDGADFIIRDDQNGGARRSPRTLSGGETFMAALCLALALSANIQLKNNALLEFFFLDEGFGTLDTAALDTVMTALEQLPREQLTVGVITHVEEMKLRIPRYLQVTPSAPGDYGTRVTVH